MKCWLIMFLFTLTLSITMSQAENRLNAEWEVLFDGKTLNGWVQRGGEAKYLATDGCIVGSSVKGTTNSFLCTKEEYSNFILELEFWVSAEMNSGIQIRSNSLEDYQNGRVHGYQVEIDPTARAWSAGIYDESRRGWLYDLRNNEAARKACKPGEWNQLHIEAIGNHIRTWLNGVPATHLVDSMTRTGFIALQVHASSKDGIIIKWRNIRILDLGTCTEFPQVITGQTQ